MILTGVFAHSSINGAVTTNGLYYGETGLFVSHLIGLVGAIVFTLVLAFILLKVVDTISPIRVKEEDEEIGLDISQHGEKL
jgi:Amt family ammonium transporter